MDSALLLKFISALAFVVSLMLLLSWALKRFGFAGALIKEMSGKERRLKIVEFLPLDHQRRLMLVRCDDREHLLLIGRQSETVVAANLPIGNSNIVEFSKGLQNVQT